MKFEYDGTILELYENTDILKNWTRLYAYTYYLLVGTAMISITAMMMAIIVSIIWPRILQAAMDAIGPLLATLAALFFIVIALIEIISRKLNNKRFTKIKFRDTTIVGDLTADTTTRGYVKIKGRSARIIDPDIDAPSYM